MLDIIEISQNVKSRNIPEITRSIVLFIAIPEGFKNKNMR
ncbi:16889_t:CDS:2 [Dentiscutata erythropus]|uniref:16889_t:CDS:1 n=1 Tax=Dentiscutata erythropus TaxID=1348616 RepID=A0A9N8V7Y3_9GLOM|nr:16889_t:CDS:2 [Dentiscutata erythropus]